MQKFGLVAIVATLLLSACATAQPVPTLDEKLAGKTPAERQAILREECKNEATKGHRGVWPRPSSNYYDTTYVPHVQELSNICKKMTNVPKNGEK